MLRFGRSPDHQAELAERGRQYRSGGNLYWFLTPRPYREARLRSYLIAQHRIGRTLADIVNDDDVRRCGTESLAWSVLLDPETIEAFEQDIHTAFAHSRAQLRLTGAGRNEHCPPLDS